MLMTFQSLNRVQTELRTLADVNEPIKWATHEMEINVNGIAIGTLGYLGAPHPKFQELVTNDESDFEWFHAEYLRLAVTQAEKDFGHAIRRLFEQLMQHSRELKHRRDLQRNTFAHVVTKLQEMDHVIDHELQANLNPWNSDDSVKLQSLNAVEADLAEVGMMVANYRLFRQESSQALVIQELEECRATLAQLLDLKWMNEDQHSAVRSLNEVFGHTTGQIIEVICDEDEIQRASTRFLSLRDEMDAMLDEQMQPLALELLEVPHKKANDTASFAVYQIKWLIPFFVILSSLAALALTRKVTKPLKLLVRGTQAVGRGDLASRVSPVGNDEFADLGQAFNRMVARLQETLVSKELLQKSEQELKQSLDALRLEIAQRIKGEEERIRLQTSLRRVQSMSAMGTLVAGISHQVRNPLFGISSVLDAMEARLGKREEYQRYLPVLREQVDRVTTLMHELMEYGRAGNVGHSISTIADVIQETVKSCQALAENAQVTIEKHLDSMPPVIMDRPQLGRALECLLENAIQYSPVGGAVTLTTKAFNEDGKEWVEICVEDCGPGFKIEQLPHVFEPFFTHRLGGTGLGLALVERIVESHGGQVAAANRLDGGAMLRVTLPTSGRTS